MSMLGMSMVGMSMVGKAMLGKIGQTFFPLPNKGFLDVESAIGD
jgi:hypothetical protein